MIALTATERADLKRIKRSAIHGCLWTGAFLFAVGALLEAGVL